MSNIRSFDYYLQRYQLGMSYTLDVEYDSPASVRRNNRGAGIYRKAAQAIGEHYPERIRDFSKELSNENQDARLATAVCILTLMNAPEDIRETAINMIREVAKNGSSLDRMAWGVWLERHPECANIGMEKNTD